MRVISPTATGGPGQNFRFYTDNLKDRFGQSFILENMPGGSGLDLLDKIEINQSYTKSDTLQVMRILKNYDLLKDTQLDLLSDRTAPRRAKP